MSTNTTTFRLDPVAPASGAAGRDKVAGPVVSLDGADHLFITRRPFRTGYRVNNYSGFVGRSVRAELYRVTESDVPRYAPESVVLLGGRGGSLSFGSAPSEVRTLFRAELADAWAARPESEDVYAYIVWSYDTPIAWGFHYAPAGQAYRPEVIARKVSSDLAGVTVTRTTYRVADQLTIPDVRYSNTTTRHQTACVLAHVNVNDPAEPVADRWGPHAKLVSIGRRVNAGDPGAVRAGRGGSPFGPRAGW